MPQGAAKLGMFRVNIVFTRILSQWHGSAFENKPTETV